MRCVTMTTHSLFVSETMHVFAHVQQKVADIRSYRNKAPAEHANQPYIYTQRVLGRRKTKQNANKPSYAHAATAAASSLWSLKASSSPSLSRLTTRERESQSPHYTSSCRSAFTRPIRRSVPIILCAKMFPTPNTTHRPQTDRQPIYTQSNTKYTP